MIDKSGKDLKTEKWGLINLANKIKKKKGIFVHFKMEMREKQLRRIRKTIIN